MLAKLYVLLSSLHDDEGATALEYGVLVALIALIIVGGVTTFGGALNDWFTRMANQVPK